MYAFSRAVTDTDDKCRTAIDLIVNLIVAVFCITSLNQKFVAPEHSKSAHFNRETDRLILRKFVSADAAGMFNGWASDEKVTKYLSWNPHQSVAETQVLVDNWLGRYDDFCYNWVVELKTTHELIGNISAISVSRRHHNCEIGYCYGSRYWNQGYATEALKAVIDYMLYDCEMHIVEAKHQSLNPASGRVMEKAGMTKDAVLKERRYHAETNSYCDLVCYSAMK